MTGVRVLVKLELRNCQELTEARMCRRICRARVQMRKLANPDSLENKLCVCVSNESVCVCYSNLKRAVGF